MSKITRYTSLPSHAYVFKEFRVETCWANSVAFYRHPVQSLFIIHRRDLVRSCTFFYPRRYWKIAPAFTFHSMTRRVPFTREQHCSSAISDRHATRMKRDVSFGRHRAPTASTLLNQHRSLRMIKKNCYTLREQGTKAEKEKEACSKF